MLELLLELAGRAFSIFLPALPFLGAWFLLLRVKRKTQSAAHLLLTLLYGLYLSGVLAVTGIGRPFGFRPRFNFLPFVDMIKGPIDTALNVLLFLPLGVLLPLLYAEFENAKKTLLAACILSFSIECIQMFGLGMFGLGITDVNDLLTNAAGAMLGFALSKTRRAMIPADRKKKLQAAAVPGTWEAALLAVIMILCALCFTPAWR